MWERAGDDGGSGGKEKERGQAGVSYPLGIRGLVGSSNRIPSPTALLMCTNSDLVPVSSNT